MNTPLDMAVGSGVPAASTCGPEARQRLKVTPATFASLSAHGNPRAGSGLVPAMSRPGRTPGIRAAHPSAPRERSQCEPQ